MVDHIAATEHTAVGAMVFSVVTPVYNRSSLMHRSLQSSLALIAAGFFSELVVVDDGSTDDSVAVIRRQYAQAIAEGTLRLIELGVNQGVAAAKNAGAQAATGDWLIFMDSDDWFVDAQVPAMLQNMQQKHAADVFFFRCRDQQSRALIGRPMSARELSLADMLNGGTPGECLPVVRRSVILQHLYPAALRGSEGLSYLAMLKAGFRIHLSELVVREYDDISTERLSSPAGLKKRARFLFLHNVQMLKYWRHARLSTLCGWLARLGYYGMLTLRNWLVGQPRR